MKELLAAQCGDCNEQNQRICKAVFLTNALLMDQAIFDALKLINVTCTEFGLNHAGANKRVVDLNITEGLKRANCGLEPFQKELRLQQAIDNLVPRY